MTWTIQGTSLENIYQELELESLKSRRWYRRLSCMFDTNLGGPFRGLFRGGGVKLSPLSKTC